MSYTAAAALQAAIFTHLSADAALVALVGSNIHDQPPPGPLPGLHVVLGEEDATAETDTSGALARHEVQITVLSEEAGFAAVKQVAGAVAAALDDPSLTLASGRLVTMRFLRARALRGKASSARRIELRFRALVDAD